MNLKKRLDQQRARGMAAPTTMKLSPMRAAIVCAAVLEADSIIIFGVIDDKYHLTQKRRPVAGYFPGDGRRPRSCGRHGI